MDIEHLSEEEQGKHRYVKESDVRSLYDISEKICNGFCIILDIKDSTKRKKDDGHDRWIEQTRVFYNAFNTLSERLSKIEQLQLITQKFEGDGVMSFFKDRDPSSTFANQHTASSLCYAILKGVIRFKEEIENEEFLHKMKIKAVVTYLTDIHIIEIGHDNKKNDVLGLGIDFSFRIGQFSDIGYIIVNHFIFKFLVTDEVNRRNNKEIYKESALHKALAPMKIDLSDLGSYSLLTVGRSVKGWATSQYFHIMVNKGMLIDMIKYLKDDDQDRSIYKELLSYYCSESQQEEEQNDLKDILHLPSGNNKF